MEQKESKEYAREHESNMRGEIRRPGMHASDYSPERKTSAIYQDIYQALGDESGIDVKVEHSTVRLCGEVDNEDIHQGVIQTVKEISGVKDVIDELRVKPFNQ